MVCALWDNGIHVEEVEFERDLSRAVPLTPRIYAGY